MAIFHATNWDADTEKKFGSMSSCVLRAARGMAEMTQEQVAARAEIKVQQYQRYERPSYRGQKLGMMTKLLWVMGFEMNINFEKSPKISGKKKKKPGKKAKK